MFHVLATHAKHSTHTHPHKKSWLNLIFVKIQQTHHRRLSQDRMTCSISDQENNLDKSRGIDGFFKFTQTLADHLSRLRETNQQPTRVANILCSSFRHVSLIKRSRYSVLLGGKLLLLHWINFDHGLWRDWLYMQPKSCCNRVLASAFPPNLDAAILFFYLPACHRFCTRQKSNPKLILSWYRTRVYVFEKNVTHTFLQELYQNISIHQARYNQIYYERGCKLI